MNKQNIPLTKRALYVAGTFLPKYLGPDFKKVYKKELTRNVLRTVRRAFPKKAKEIIRRKQDIIKQKHIQRKAKVQATSKK